jgi:hypothetical protein
MIPVVYFVGSLANPPQTAFAKTAINIITANTFSIKMQLGKVVMHPGQMQIIKFSVVDTKTGQPINGTLVRATVTYADGKTVRDFAGTTDTSGHASYQWRLEKNVGAGTFSVSGDVSASQYEEESLSLSFEVLSSDQALTTPSVVGVTEHSTTTTTTKTTTKTS